MGVTLVVWFAGEHNKWYSGVVKSIDRRRTLPVLATLTFHVGKEHHGEAWLALTAETVWGKQWAVLTSEAWTMPATVRLMILSEWIDNCSD